MQIKNDSGAYVCISRTDVKYIANIFVAKFVSKVPIGGVIIRR